MEKKIPANGNIVVDNVERMRMVNLISMEFKEILEHLKFDLTDQQIHETPTRWAKMMVNELLIGCYTEKPKMTVFDNTQNYDEMVIVGPLEVKSMCSHHFVPFRGEAYIAYIPKDKVCGISKLSRILTWYMRRPQIQEELTKQIADYIEETLQPDGCAVYIKAQHECMIVRGVQETNSWMQTSDLRGSFKQDQSTRKEFFSLVKQ